MLIADDDTKLTKMLSRMLAYKGYRVLTATDG
jgi:DNA-binding response OmpR family regulator